MQNGILDWKTADFKLVHPENELFILVALKSIGKTIDFNLIELVKPLLKVYLALGEHDAGKYTF
jgi:hypothetical protein